MKIIDSKSTTEAFSEAKKHLSNLPKPSDLELLAEDTVIFNFLDLISDSTIPNFDGIRFITNFKYSSLINEPKEFVEKEFSHYEKLLELEVIKIIKYLESNKYSKRAIINVWNNSQRPLKNTAECLIYIFFRIIDNRLDMHVHMRANNAIDKALINFHIFAATQRYIAKALDINVGHYIHISDSYHIYN